MVGGVKRVVGHADAVLRGLPSQSVDLVFTSPPAYPSMKQGRGALGTQEDLGEYLRALGRTIFLARRVMKRDSFLVLVIEPLPGFNVMRPLVAILRRGWFKLLTTYHWSHSTGSQGEGGSWVIFLGKGGARLNRQHPAWESPEWFFPRPPADPEYSFYEWPSQLVEAVVGLTIPHGGSILDPFAGKAQALGRLSLRYDVTAVDVLNLGVETCSDEANPVAAFDAVETEAGGHAPLGADFGGENQARQGVDA